MPGYIIHLCIAKEYMKKHDISDEKIFCDGTVYPDNKPDKNITHYSTSSSAGTNLYQFLLDKKLDSAYNQGYFLHLLADCLFYNKYFSGWKNISRELLYNDYDILNKPLLDRYNLEYIPKGVEKYFNVSKMGETIEYHYDKIVQFIEEVSNYNLEELAQEILLKKDYKFLFL